MKSITTLLAILIGSLLAAGLLLGPGWLRTHFLAGQERLKAHMDQQVSSDAQEAGRIKILLRDFDEKIFEYEDKLAEVKTQLDTEERHVALLGEQVRKEREILAKAKELLEGGAADCVIQGRTYTRAEVEADARARINRCKSQEDQLAVKQQIAARLREAWAEGTSNLAKLQGAKATKRQELEILEVRLQNSRLIGQALDMSEGIKQAPLAPETELGNALRNFEKRVRAAERRNVLLSSPADGGSMIDWEHGSEVPAVDAIEEFLRTAPPQSAPEERPERRSELEAAEPAGLVAAPADSE